MYLCRNYANAKCAGRDTRCTRHSINRKLLEGLVVDELRRVTEFARSNKAKFSSVIRAEKDKSADKILKAKTSQLAKDEKRIAELDVIINRIYEDHVAENLSSYRFKKMLAAYENEQAALRAEVETLRVEISSEKEKVDSIGKFLKLCEEYTEIPELTAEIVRTFIEKIVIHEAVKAPGHKYKKQSQQIDIHFSFIGEFPKE